LSTLLPCHPRADDVTDDGDVDWEREQIPVALEFPHGWPGRSRARAIGGAKSRFSNGGFKKLATPIRLVDRRG
jgi:hypothetical protein